MGNVVSIDSEEFREEYVSGQDATGMLDDGLFLLGVLAMIVAAQVVCALGGPVSPWVFLVSALAGVIGGLVKYIQPPAEFASIVATPKSQDGRTKRRKLS